MKRETLFVRLTQLTSSSGVASMRFDKSHPRLRPSVSFQHGSGFVKQARKKRQTDADARYMKLKQLLPLR